MKTAIIYYSMTGRNDKLSQLVADKLGLERIKIQETKPRKVMTVAWDLILNRTPKVTPSPDVMDGLDMVILFAPVWMGSFATPMKAYLKHIKKTGKPYAFVFLSGGAEESNPNLVKSVEREAGKKADLILDLHVSSLMDGSPTREETQSYKMSDEEYEAMGDRAVSALLECEGFNN